jgi:DNA-binding HxlR family transcriptional regulator
MPTATAETARDAGSERAGSLALSVFVRGLNAGVLRAHAGGPLSFAELEKRLGLAAEASLRAATTELCALGALERESRQPILTKLTPGGRDLLWVADSLESWLSRSPFGAGGLDDAPARRIVKALLAGWDSTVVQALAERPRRLTELSREIPGHSYASVKRCLASLRVAALVECLDGSARSPKQEATSLLRRAAGVLGIAARWDLHHAVATGLDEHDVSAILLLTLPMAQLPRLSGSCVLAVAKPRSVRNSQPPPTAIRVVVEQGRVVDAGLVAAATSEGWALASPEAWLEATIGGRLSQLRIGGPNARLVKAAVEGIHQTLAIF